MATLDRTARSLLLSELVSGMWLTLRYFFRPRPRSTTRYEKVPLEPALQRRARAAPLPERRGTLHRLQALRGDLPRASIIIEAEPRDDGSRRTTRYDIDMTKCIYCGLCEEACPVDAIVEGPNIEFATETREELIYNKDKLLANGDLWESGDRQPART